MLFRALGSYFLMVLIAACFSLLTTPTVAQEVDIEAAKKEAHDAILKVVNSYVAAFNAKDAKKMASHWSPRGVYTSRTTGNMVVGNAALEKEFASLFKELDNLTLKATTDEIEFISPSVAIEHGQAIVTQKGNDRVERSEYSAVFVNRDGRWLIDRIDDNIVLDTTSHHAHLKELEWIIGKWTASQDQTTADFECKWTADQNHISRAYRIVTDGLVEQSGLQIIGWDPKNKRIRSWLFDSDGGYIEGTWKKDGDRWVVTNTGTLPDGGTGTSVNIVKPVDAYQFSFQKTKQVIDGEKVEDTPEIIVKRQK